MRAHRLVPAAAAIACLVFVCAAVVWAVGTNPDPGRPAEPPRQADPPPAGGLVAPASPAGPIRVAVQTPGYWSWAVLDRGTGQIAGGPEPAGTNSTESMIKAWIVADQLRRYSERGVAPPTRVLRLASAAIRVSDDEAAQFLYLEGGGDAVIARLIDRCALTGTTIYPDWWSRTEMTARDAVRMGQCLTDGRAAGPEWTDWVLREMRRVRGTTDPADQPHGGRWGIIDALPPELADRGRHQERLDRDRRRP